MILSLVAAFIAGMIPVLLVIMIRDTRKIMRDTASMAANIRDIALCTHQLNRRIDKMTREYPEVIDSDG